jgi:hypothetical protein
MVAERITDALWIEALKDLHSAEKEARKIFD